jgi:chlorite dismutase
MTDSRPIYALYAGFRAAEGDDRLPDEQRPAAAAEAQGALESTGATVRGTYTTTGYRAEADPIVDLMRHLRAAEARRYTREELPFLTGRRRSLVDAVTDLP